MPDQDPTRERILEAAGPLFAEKGFDATGVREITAAAGTNAAAVNYHFRNKEELYAAAVRHAADQCDGQTPIPTWPPGTPAEQRLREFIAAFLRRLLRDDGPAWHRLLIFREVANPRPGSCEEFVKHFVRPTFHALLGVVRDLVPPRTPERTLRLLAGSVIGQCLHYHHARHVIRMLVGPEEWAAFGPELLTDHIFRFSLAAIRAYHSDGGTP